MRYIELDGRAMDSRMRMHQHLQEKLDLPDYYGKNLDALGDCLGEKSDLRIILRYAAAMRNSLGEYGEQLLRVFRAAQEGRSDLRFIIKDN